MQRSVLVTALLVIILSCNQDAKKKGFEVSGTISNSPVKMIYLEEVPMATMQQIVVDSVTIGSDGHYSLSADSKEETVFNLRLGQSDFPLTSVINDAPKITLNASFTKDKMQFMDNYEVKGSTATQQLKEFLYSFTDKIKNIYVDSQKMDSLKKTNAADSVTIPVAAAFNDSVKQLKEYTLNSIAKSGNPALGVFELGYYQSTANNPIVKIEPLADEEVNTIVNDLSKQFPSHNGLAVIKKSLEAQLQKTQGWVGKEAPDFSLPDVSGNEVKLSSFRGKYVLVDFWASWCNPCRHENPNVVKAYDQFKNKNFAILGVSLDRPEGKNSWLQAIKEDNLTWTQVSDLGFWDSKVVSLYNLEEIPYNVLIDPNGKVIAEKLRGDDLEKKLSEVLK